jgi:hypothetical protein
MNMFSRRQGTQNSHPDVTLGEHGGMTVVGDEPL